MRDTSIIARAFFRRKEEVIKHRGEIYFFPFPFPNLLGSFPRCCGLPTVGFFAAVRDILTPDHTPVPCMDSFAPTAYAKPSAAVFKVQKIGMMMMVISFGEFHSMDKCSRKIGNLTSKLRERKRDESAAAG